MKIIKTSNYINIILSKNEWWQIGFSSGWLNKTAEEMDLTRQKADTDKLWKAYSKLKADIGELQNTNDPNISQKVKDSILMILDDTKDNNWVAQLDAEIGLRIDDLSRAMQSNDFITFNNILEKYFQTELQESEKQLNLQLQKQKNPTTNINTGIENITGDMPL